MFDCTDAARTTPDERLREIAKLLATGIRGLRQRAALPLGSNAETPAELSSNDLELSAETRLSVRVG